MTLDALETAVFGYKKESVFRFITEVEQGFSAKLLEQEKTARQKEAQMQRRIQQLEQECDALRSCLAEQQRGQLRSAALLADAEQMAELLQAETAVRERTVRQMLEEDRIVRQQMLDRYLAQLRAACDLQEDAAGSVTELQEMAAAEPAEQNKAMESEAAAAKADAAAALGTVDADAAQHGEEPAAAESPVTTADGARSVRVGGTNEVYQADNERNMSMFQRRVYPAD